VGYAKGRDMVPKAGTRFPHYQAIDVPSRSLHVPCNFIEPEPRVAPSLLHEVKDGLHDPAKLLVTQTPWLCTTAVLAPHDRLKTLRHYYSESVAVGSPMR
jgi:hypothetical protein